MVSVNFILTESRIVWECLEVGIILIIMLTEVRRMSIVGGTVL